MHIAARLACLGWSMFAFSGTAQAAVGRTAGAFEVNGGGEAVYSIPFAAPPGVRGLTPQLALVYSHRSGQTIAGAGWGIAGVSAITRCASTVVQDQVARNVRNDSLDRFCLNGNKLRLISGSYGVAGSEYRTELETYQRIKAFGLAGNGPQYFIVEGRDGLVYEYGNTGNSSIESVGQSTVRAWALNKVRDRDFNEINFTYAEDVTNGSYKLDLVSYGGNSQQPTAAIYTIDLVYEAKPVGEVDSGYLAGSRIKETQRLDRVDVLYNGTTLYRRYDLAYEAALSATSLSRLASLTECAGATPECLAPTVFTYQDGSPLSAEADTGVVIPATTTFPLDVNGDGREDLVYSLSTGAGQWMVMFANSTGGYATSINTGVANTGQAGAIPIDYNADGKMDLLVPYSGGTWWVTLGSASGLGALTNTGAPATATGTGNNARALDVDGDGLDDLVWADLVGYAGGDVIRYRLRVAGAAFSATATNLITPLPADQMIPSGLFTGWAQTTMRRAPDFNGDGRRDLVYRRFKRISTALAAPPGSEAVVQENLAGGETLAAGYNYQYHLDVVCPGVTACFTTTAGLAGRPYFGDFNGDGLSDLFYLDGAGLWQYRFSTGTGFTATQSAGSLTAYDSMLVYDWDGDGIDDVLATNLSTSILYVLRSTGETLLAPVSTGIAAPGSIVTDLNGDHLHDLAYRGAGGTWRYRARSLTFSYPDLLATATDGFGVAATYAYAPITSATVYTKGTGAVYPDIDVQQPLWVVSSLTSTDGSGNNATFASTYTYETARLHLQGRGFLGFARRTVVDNRLSYNLKTIDVYKQNFPYIGALESREQRQGTGTRISFVQNTWTQLTWGTTGTARAFPYVSTTTADQHEVGGVNNGTRIRTVAMSVAGSAGIDAVSGLIIDATTTTTEVATGLFPASYKTERTQHTAVQNDTANWCLGRPTATSQTNGHTLNGGVSVTRTSDMTWDGAKCRPTQARLEPVNPTLQVTVGYGYDLFGNVSTETVTGVAMAARTTTTSWGASGQLPLTVTNALSQTTTQGWNVALGLPASVTDPNSLTVSWTYDAFGRRTVETRPDQTSTVWTYSACSGGCDARIKLQVLQEERDSASATFRTQTNYLDRWERPIWQQTQLLTVNDQTNSLRREYDARGRVSRDYVPYLVNAADNGYRSFVYDSADRTTSESLYRAGGALDRTTSFAYNGLVASQTDPLNHTTTRATNAWGALVRVTDAANGQVNLQYDAFDLLKQATDPANNVVSQVSYNVRGMRTQLADMDLGTWNYTPNALGEVVSQTDAKSQATTFVYDLLGRPATRTESEGTSTWTWGTLADNTASNKYVGRLKSVTSPGYAESFTYDAKSRPLTRTITADASYQFDYAYNTLGQLDTLTYPTSTAGVRFKAKYGYGGGYLSSVQEYTGNVNGPILWNLNLLDARMNATSETYGNGLWLQNGFDAATGEPRTRQSGTGGQSSNVQNLSYVWDTAGNLSNRQDLRQSLTETFTYDALDRLTLASGPAAQSTAIGYNAIGNLTSKTGVGTYTYHATKKHAVVSAGGASYGYDGNGNLTSRSGATVTWSSYNLPTYIADPNGYSAQFWYAPDRSRWKQVSSYTGGTETTLYVGGLLEKLTTPTRTHWKHLIPTPSGQVQVIRRTDGTTDTFYVTTDHLGSTDAVLNAAGTVLMRGSFGVHGARRASNWQGAPSGTEWQAI
ncbi:MAG: FG-GAP-like repeat-containing protein, partial [Proteobacteria bacterium]|nr:FG-GAP-like repeat-containing protein [Pseudomonadota bacterium]